MDIVFSSINVKTCAIVLTNETFIYISNIWPYLQCLHQVWFDCFLHKHCKCTTYTLKRKQSEYSIARAKWPEKPRGKYVEKHDPQ